MTNPKDLRELATQIRQQILNDVDDPRTRQLGALIVRKYDVPARDPVKLARAVQLFAQNIKFFREFPEVIAAPWVTSQWGIGDCDDKSRLIAAVLKSFRIPVRLIYLTYKRPKEPGNVSHVYPEAFLGNDWVALESVRQWPMGKNAKMMLENKGRAFEVFNMEI